MRCSKDRSSQKVSSSLAMRAGAGVVVRVEALVVVFLLLLLVLNWEEPALTVENGV